MKIHPIHHTVAALIFTSNVAHAGFRNFQAAHLVPGRTSGAVSVMKGTSAVVVDPVSQKVFVCDSGNHRVLRFGTVAFLTGGSAAEAVFGQTTLFSTFLRGGADGMTRPQDVVVDASGTLWVADEHRVLRFDQAATKPSSSPADGVMGQVDFTTTSTGVSSSVMLAPSGLAVSGTTLYVSDYEANRMLRFDNAATKSNGAAAQAVFGQASFTAISADVTASRFNQPQGLAVDPSGTETLWVADQSNHRVLAFANVTTATVNPGATRVLGQTTFTGKIGVTPPTFGRTRSWSACKISSACGSSRPEMPSDSLHLNFPILSFGFLHAPLW